VYRPTAQGLCFHRADGSAPFFPSRIVFFLSAAHFTVLHKIRANRRHFTMGRRASKGSTAGSSSSNPVQQLNMLRDFCGGAGSWTEAEFTDCLRQCGYNVERAAESLMTGQYKASTGVASGIGSRSDTKKRNGKSAYISLVSSPTQQKPSAQAAQERRPSKNSALKLASSSSAAKDRRKSAPLRAVPSSAAKGTPKHGNVAVQDLTGASDDDDDERWLLCHRWLSDAVCTTKHGRVVHEESLSMQHSLTGHPVVRFRGKNIEGRLPDNLSAILTPLLRMDQDGTPRKLIYLKGEALMEDNRLPIGSQIPIALKVYIMDPRAFFELFQNQEAAANTNANMFFANKARKSKKGRLPVAEAAFDLLQWAEYGDAHEFQAPADVAELKETYVDEDANDDEEEEENEDGVTMNEDEFEEASVAESTAEAKEWDQQVNSTNGWMMSLPESPDPTGFRDVTLRPYQRQALYWMMKREQEGESREELDRQITLLSELAINQKPRSSVSIYSKPSSGKEIVCDCSPVLLSAAASKKSKTVDGQVDPVNHPLWQRRFLASDSMNESLSFYVNELLGGATHLPPTPPSPCSGGILADSMGLGYVLALGWCCVVRSGRIVGDFRGPTTDPNCSRSLHCSHTRLIVSLSFTHYTAKQSCYSHSLYSRNMNDLLLRWKKLTGQPQLLWLPSFLCYRSGRTS
jgi:hypothetical protein